MAFDKTVTKQYFTFLEQAGYQYSKDNLGYYFDNGTNRFSIMKTGPLLMCYFNKKIGKSWNLKSKSQSFLDFNLCLQWILTQIQKGD